MTSENPDVNVNNDLDEALAIVGPMIDNGSSEDEMVIALIQSGVKYARAGRLLAKVLESKGLKLSSKDRYEAAKENLANWAFAPETWDDVEEAATNLSEEIDATTFAQAMSCIRRYAKDNGFELPEKPKTGRTGPRSNIFTAFYDWAMDHRDASRDEIAAFIGGHDVPEKQAKKYLERFTGILSFAHRFNG